MTNPETWLGNILDAWKSTLKAIAEDLPTIRVQAWLPGDDPPLPCYCTRCGIVHGPGECLRGDQ